VADVPSTIPQASGGGRLRRRGRRRKPQRFRDLPRGAWRRIARRTFDHYRSDGVTNLAAALTFRSVLSVFPALIALVALLGVLGQYPQTFNSALTIIEGFAPASTVQSVVATPLRAIITNKGGAGALLGVGLAGAIWGASGYVGTFSWACNVIWEARRGRSWYRQWPFNFAVTIVGLALMTLTLSALVLTGPVATSVGDELGIGSTTLRIWGIAKWPLILLVVAGLISVLYYFAPNVRPPSWRWLTPGASFAIVVWAIATALFGVYIAHFSSYDATYGSLGAIVSFLIWVWLTNIAMLLGIELDSEIERERQLTANPTDPDARIQLPLRQS
jgi:membrane protein